MEVREVFPEKWLELKSEWYTLARRNNNHYSWAIQIPPYGHCYLVIFLLIVKLAIDFLLKTKFGFVLKALGDNESLVTALGLDGNKLKLYGLMIANSLVALSGGILAQYQGFADVGMGTWTIITGLASIIIGEAVIGKKKIGIFSLTSKHLDQNNILIF